MILYNTLTKKKQEFYTINNGEVKIYACGPTVYNLIHIGNARPICVFDVLRRYLIYKGFNVKYVQNFTDVDDKIIKKANEEKLSCSEISNRYISEYNIDASGLNILPADVHPRATETIPEIISMVQTLIDKGFAYLSDGDVYFDSSKFEDYGHLSGQPLEKLEEGVRIEQNIKKRNSLDFVIWKSSKPGEPSWASPWGAGRPGWHIECSAMIKKHLGATIDIHCGGQDLIFPHHENEIAQSVCANGKNLANFWLHNGFINIDNKKMSKSLNNFFTVREMSKKYGYQPIRYLMIASHYKSPLNFSEESIIQCKNSLSRLSNFKSNLNFIKKSRNNQNHINTEEIKENFLKYMDDDLNISGALSVVFDLVKDINSRISEGELFSAETINSIESIFNDFMSILGLELDDKTSEIPEDIAELVKKRETARKNKDWATADSIRDLLKQRGYILEDSKSGVRILNLAQ